jgi:hypothetical protein|nr:MAG TPA: hypothetical protein [Caudoviricetes sp.]
MAKKDDKEQQVPETDISEAAATAAKEAYEATPVPATERPAGRVRAFMLAKFPDRPWEDDAELENGVADWLEEADKSLADYRTADEKIRSIAEKYPEIMAIADDLAKNPGMPLGVAIRRNIDEDELEVGEDDPGFEQLRKSREERASRRKAREEYQQQLDRNLEASREIVEKYLADNEMSEEEAAALGKYVDDIMEAYLDGRLTVDVLNMFRNAMNYSKDVADAREVGKVEGMNANIDAERQRRQEATDGLPGPGSSTGQIAPPAPAEPSDMIDEILKRNERRYNMLK